MNREDVLSAIREVLELAPEEERAQLVQDIRQATAPFSPGRAHPVDQVAWVPVDQVEPNDYNPNSVARAEMALLAHSIRHDGYTQPVVAVYDPARGKYIIVDGFHRYFTMKACADIAGTTGGLLPVVTIARDINDRMAATVRHNRARGKHSLGGMSSLVFSMLDGGWEDHEICNELGLTPEELLRLKHITGFSKLYADAEYSRAWVTRSQLRLAKEQDRGGA